MAGSGADGGRDGRTRLDGESACGGDEEDGSDRGGGDGHGKMLAESHVFRPNSVKIKSRYFAGFCGLKHVPCMSNLLGIFVLGHYGALYTQNDENDVIFF